MDESKHHNPYMCVCISMCVSHERAASTWSSFRLDDCSFKADYRLSIKIINNVFSFLKFKFC